MSSFSFSFLDADPTSGRAPPPSPPSSREPKRLLRPVFSPLTPSSFPTSTHTPPPRQSHPPPPPHPPAPPPLLLLLRRRPRRIRHLFSPPPPRTAIYLPRPFPPPRPRRRCTISPEVAAAARRRPLRPRQPWRPGSLRLCCRPSITAILSASTRRQRTCGKRDWRGRESSSWQTRPLLELQPPPRELRRRRLHPRPLY